MDRPSDTINAPGRYRMTAAAPALLVEGLIVLAVALFALLLVLCRIELDGGNSFFYTSEYRRLSEAPYTLSALRSRSFVPLIAWSVGLGSQRYAYFSLLVTFAFLGATALYLRRATGQISLTFVGTILIATLPITEFGVFALGWPDQFCYLMFILTLLLPPSGILFSIAGLLAHELYITLLLCTVFVISRPWHWRLIHLLVPLGVIWLSKSYFNFPPDGGLGAIPIIQGFLADPGGQISSQPFVLGFFSAMKIFSLLIPYAIYRSVLSGSRDIWSIALPLALAAGCLILAHDSTRIWGLALPAILVSICHLRHHQLLLAAACVANIFLPSYSVSSAWRVHLDRSFGWIELIYIAIVQGVAW
ncbi:MAG: hypothetical protein ACK5HO_04230 [Pseudomonadota bacterium]